MSIPSPAFAHQAAVEVYGAFLDECVVNCVGSDRLGAPAKPSSSKIDCRPVRLVTISGKGGWSKDVKLASSWAKNDNISLLDHLLSVARGALMFWLANTTRPWSSEAERAEIERFGHALICIAFLHDIDKDMKLPRGAPIKVDAVAERMHRYGIDNFLIKREFRISPAAMLNYIEEVEGTQACRSPAAPDYDRRIAEMCRYVELADKLEGTFTSSAANAGVDGVIASLRDPNRWPVLSNTALKQWDKVEVHDHLHVFLMDRFQRALSATCAEVAGRLPLIETVHDGHLLCVIPKGQATDIRARALDRFLNELPYRLSFSVNNRLACRFVNGVASWESCREVMRRHDKWRECGFDKLLALSRSFARAHCSEIDELFNVAGMETSWSPLDEGTAATAKPALRHPGGGLAELDVEPVHALVFLTIMLNHTDSSSKGAAPDADTREQELLDLMRECGHEPPRFVASECARTRRVLLALWTIAEVWHLSEIDPGNAQKMLDSIIGSEGLIGLWLEGDENRLGLAHQIKDTSSDMLKALRGRFSSLLGNCPISPFDGKDTAKRCILCNEPVAAALRKVDTASNAHGIKVSAFSGRDGRNDHLSSAVGDTHLCLVCLAELKLRQDAQAEFKGSSDLPPLISSPATTGLFSGLAFERENGHEISMGLNDLIRLNVGKGTVYEGVDCQTKRIRLARLETLPNNDAKLVKRLHMTLTAIRRLGRPIHIFRGAPRRHPAIFYFDAMPPWLKRLLGGDSLRIEQLSEALSSLELFEALANKPGLGVGWAKQIADLDMTVRLGALCVAWTLAIDRRGSSNTDYAWSIIEAHTRKRAIPLIKSTGGEPVKLKQNQDPLIQLALLATRIQKRIGTGASANRQLLCWKTALDFYPGAVTSISTDQSALILGLAGTLEHELKRKNAAAANKHRDGQALDRACIDFARQFVEFVWPHVFNSKEPTSKEQRRAAAVYRFALLEAYRERGIAESADNGSPSNESEAQ